jgi:aspartyl-tRNA(Asn)/glutamyl-tRNA(Gln) amidotransferase subunit B
VLADNPAQVAEFLSGKTQLQGWFVGQIMRRTRGKANPGLANRLLAEQLAALDRD